MRKILKFLLISAGILGAIGYSAVEYVLPYSPIKPFRVNIAAPSPDYGLKYEPITLLSFDSLQLSGYYISADQPRATVILMHGIADCKEHLFPLAKKLNDMHCNTIIFDHRAHGKSEGEYCTFGAKETADVQAITDYLKNQRNDTIIGIYGISLGGAIALQATAANKDIDFAVIESTFHDLESVVNEYMEDIIGFKAPSLVHRTLKKSGKIAGFDPFSIRPESACKQITCPVFMAHGESDQKIPHTFGKRNFDNLRAEDKQFILVPSANHNDLQSIGGATYWSRVEAFILAQL